VYCSPNIINAVLETDGTRKGKKFRQKSQNLKERDHFGEFGRKWVIILKWIQNKDGFRLWTIFIWLRIGTSGELL
jgi:hypothetical protein